MTPFFALNKNYSLRKKLRKDEPEILLVHIIVGIVLVGEGYKLCIWVNTPNL
jgi:hypothetical protein